MRNWQSRLACGMFASLGAALVGCNPGDGDLLRAKVIESRTEVVGGPVAVADIGDFILENDQIRVAILAARDSPGPGVFGGSVVDIDRRRRRGDFVNGNGLDRFSEMFPVANLLVPETTETDITIPEGKDGSDGEEAIIHVEGTGEFLYEALSLLREQKDLLGLFFPNIRTFIRFSTDYVLRPGASHIEMRTTLSLADAPAQNCPTLGACDLTCEHGLQADDDNCPICACSEALPLEQFTGSVSVFGTTFGDPMNQPDITPVNHAGIIAGDFVFFGNQNDVFAPGPGFDEDEAVQGAYNDGRNQFVEPLTFDVVAAAGGDISYAYFTSGKEKGGAQTLNVPLFASAATAFLVAGKNCLFDASDDEACDRQRAFTYQRYMAVGDGDVASALGEVYRVRGDKTGRVEGNVLWETTGEGVPNARVFVLTDPAPDKTWASVDAIVNANLDANGTRGVVSEIDADLGLDLLEDGDFGASMLPGRYVLVARDAAGTVTSAPLQIEVKADQTTRVVAKVPAPALVKYRITDEAGALVPAKVALVSVDDNDVPLEGDGKRRPYFGEGRLGNGNRTIAVTASGEGSLSVEPGRYLLRVSRGPEYSLWEEKGVVLTSGGVHIANAAITREVDTTGWMSTDMHLHATPSFDSGMPLPKRVTTVAAEGVELAIATDHDNETDYRPILDSLNLSPHVATAVSAETTTLEQGHFIGFPMRYDALLDTQKGAHDWTCQSGGEIMDGIRSVKDPDHEMFLIVAHPRDGFFGYVDQLGVDGFTMERKLSLLEENNPVFRTAACDFDGMEIIAAKRFDLERTPSVNEIVDWNRCLARVNDAEDLDALTAACPEVASPLVPCADGERFSDCKRRSRTKLAAEMTKRILARTPEEQDRNWDFAGSVEDNQMICDLTAIGENPVDPAMKDEPCSYRAGQVDDYFRYLERGLTPTQIGSSDGHNDMKEPGFPRTYFMSPTDAPGALSIDDAVASLRGGQAFATYGPFIKATIGGATFGQTIKASPGDKVDLLLDVLTASWFGVDRVEVYVNGRIIKVVEPDVPPTELQDLKGKIQIDVPDRDSWVVVIAMGLKDENLMSPVSVDVPFGEVQLSQLASDAFGKVPVVKDIFKPPPTTPDWTPIIPYAITNPIYIDTDGNSEYDAPLPYPPWCSNPCDPDKPAAGQCGEGQKCLSEEKVCGVFIGGQCDHRRAMHEHE